MSSLLHRQSLNQITSRLFLVGCARSGTTLLQSLLASHPLVASFPESNFFNHLFPHSEPKRRFLGLASRRAKSRWINFLSESGFEQYPPSLLAVSPNRLTSHFVKTLDLLSIQQRKTIWLEKTPSHLHHIDFIVQRVPQSKFIHIIREGKDAVASLYDVRKKYPKQWPNEPASVELSVERWLKDASTSLRYIGHSAHMLIRYENLVASPEAVLKQLCHFIEVDFAAQMLSQYATTARQVSLTREPWKVGVAKPIQNANSTKFYTLFSQSQQDYVLEHTSSIDLNALLPVEDFQSRLDEDASSVPSAA